MSGRNGLHLYTSNRLENLAEALATVLEKPLRHPFAAETVIVQSLGMKRWLTQQLARRHKICANVSYQFTERFVAGLIDDALPGRAAAAFFARENMTWRVMQLLPLLVRQNEFEPLRHYLEQPRPQLRRFQLASRIASAFDRYLAFRPRLIRDWDKDADGKDWQANLWRELTKSAPGLHPPALAEEFRAALGRGEASLPERVSFFGISTLPQFYVEVLEELARSTVVHLFFMRPTPEWWGDFRSQKDEAKARRKRPASAQLDLKFDRAGRNPLLESLGKLGREFLEIVTAIDFAGEYELFHPPEETTMLGQIQRDIFELRDSRKPAKQSANKGDCSLQFHSCHSPMREMEVLHDQLLALFEKFPDLKPHDVVVMAPDISVYAPFIGAVFDTAPERVRIPFSISDRGGRAENGVIDTFLRLLELAGSRFTASSVMAILESSALQRRFELVETDLEVIRNWMEKTGIRWGIDAAHRGSFDLPEFAENSWRAGLDRLLLGYAAPARGEQLFENILAFDDVEGELAETLGHFAEVADALFATARELKESRSLGAWQEILRQISERFFPEDDEREPELRELRRVLDSLGELARLSQFTEPVPLDVLIAHLEQALATSESRSGFLVGRVTFCALKPMRAVPFRIVCLVGMNDTDYPRHDRAPAFDLVAQQPQPGDRSTRNDDRYLFLEALLSARDVFYVSYLGQSIRDNSAIPPSVLVSELLDYTGARPVVHPLQPFSTKYFAGDSNLFSYSKENCAASEVAREARSALPAFITAPIAEPEEELRHVDANRLVSFFGNPAKFFIEQRLGLRVPKTKGLLEDSEPLAVDGLPKYLLQEKLVAHAVGGRSFEPLMPLARAGGELPPGHAGGAALREMCVAADDFSKIVRQHANQVADEPRDISFAADDFELSARLDHLHGGRLVRYRLTTRKPKDLLRSWIEHLIANTERATESVLITADKDGAPVQEKFFPIEKAEATRHLRDLLAFYWRGLREPLQFFPRSSLAYMEQMLRPKGKRSPIQAAHAKWRRAPETWEQDKGEQPENEDPYFHLAFRHLEDPLDEEWEKLTVAIFAPPVKAVRK